MMIESIPRLYIVTQITDGRWAVELSGIPAFFFHTAEEAESFAELLAMGNKPSQLRVLEKGGGLMRVVDFSEAIQLKLDLQR
jgi:hypothetical protein